MAPLLHGADGLQYQTLLLRNRNIEASANDDLPPHLLCLGFLWAGPRSLGDPRGGDDPRVSDVGGAEIIPWAEAAVLDQLHRCSVSCSRERNKLISSYEHFLILQSSPETDLTSHLD